MMFYLKSISCVYDNTSIYYLYCFCCEIKIQKS